MKRIFIPIILLLITVLASTSCRMAPSNNLGDTVAAKVFEPIDTTGHGALAKKQKKVSVKDSTGVYFIGEGSTEKRVQLVSYPSRRDTAIYNKGKHIRVTGNADYGHVVRAKLWISDRGDTLVTRLEEYQISK
ncbi:MAG: hypothetical protein I3J02_02970 [Prevotella sp.]|nr:hypothetical protein [Prevotella sp.]